MLGFLLLQEKKEAKNKNDNWNFRIWVFVQEWPFRDAHLFFKNCFAETSILWCFLGARFLGQVVKKWKFWTPTKKKKKLTDN